MIVMKKFKEYHCYECGKKIDSIHSLSVFSFDNLNYAHIWCLKWND